MEKSITFAMLEDQDRQDLIRTISDSYQFAHDPPTTAKESYFDSFDWLLHNENLVLLKHDDTYCLKDMESSKVVAECPWEHKDVTRFWWDFPDCEIAALLKSCLDVRALLPFLEIEKRSEKLHILNEDEKTVLRVYLDEINPVGDAPIQKTIRTITLEPVRGYLKEFHDFYQFIEGTKVAEPCENLFNMMLKLSPRKPGDYSSKMKVALTRDMSGSMATRKILLYLLNVMKQNEEGVISDIDTEFLHDFRVSGRRTRSALSQIKDVFPDAKLDRFKEDFRELGQSSNKLRDLDVYLHKKEEYLAMLPVDLRPGLDPFFMDLEKQRKKELKGFTEVLRSDFYRQLVTDWEAFLVSDGDYDMPARNAEKPVITLAREFIWRRYTKIMKAGAKIDNETPDENLHSLRIQCKKLRYLMEFFASLFPSGEIALLTKQLKRFQDNLGEFNDLSMQQGTLKEYLDTINPESDQNMLIAAAIGGLITNLNVRQHHVRAEFSDQFRNFGQKNNRLLFKQLFKDGDRTTAKREVIL
ncbi:MAG: CHAD domain protein [Candidatus Argoarchaeum ethanivorans]|uniref:CHAD domain protein n=1 Tax=Candidatus Argoarchaeum ethanivorans TaxID=2608793 RepID=A0A811ZZL0_9EURY|nr:MAG: CHAD domain protein [Candidatus Argoarchaeum ethanivorans]